MKDYKLSELIKGNSPELYYFIPPEIVTNDIFGKYYSVTKENGGWVYCRKFNWYLNKLGWTDQEWYNVFILHIGRFEVPKCIRCGSNLSWAGKISWGYYSYCSLACSQADLGENEWFRNNRRDYMIDRWSNDEDYITKLTNSEQAIKRYSNLHRGRAISYALANNINIGYFYYTYDESRIKIGISLNDVNLRMDINDLGIGYIFKGPVMSVIDLEYELKCSLFEYLINPKDSGHTGYTETFNISSLDIIISKITEYNLTECK